MRLTRRYRFPASHRLHNPDLTEEENRVLYGKCNNPHGHGHDYVLEVSVRGPVDGHGRVADRADLDRRVEQHVLCHFRHRNLNLDLPEFAGLPPTSENLAAVIEQRLRQAGLRPELEKVRLCETRRNFVEK